MKESVGWSPPASDQRYWKNQITMARSFLSVYCSVAGSALRTGSHPPQAGMSLHYSFQRAYSPVVLLLGWYSYSVYSQTDSLPLRINSLQSCLLQVACSWTYSQRLIPLKLVSPRTKSLSLSSQVQPGRQRAMSLPSLLLGQLAGFGFDSSAVQTLRRDSVHSKLLGQAAGHSCWCSQSY